MAYCRVSTLDQHTEIQEEALRKAYPQALIFTEKASATSLDGRPVLETVLSSLQPGSKVVVWKLDRLARNLADLLAIVQRITSQGASLEVLDQRIDTATAAGKAFLQMLGVFAEFENNLRRERQLAGIAKAKAQGKYKGRTVQYNEALVRQYLQEGKSHREIASRLGCSTKTVQRVAKKEKE
ncbi:recombinase family protein [Megalodesulfovibrio paquesii]